MADSPQRERQMGLPRVEKGGRFFTKYDPNIALDIVERIADGELLKDITAKDAVPLTITKQTFLRWVATVPELSTAYSAALQISAQSFEENALQVAKDTYQAPGSPQKVSAANLLVGQYRWSAARRNPTKYSDKGNTQIVVPININTTLDLGSSDRQGRDVEVPDIYTIKLPVVEGEFSEVDETREANGGTHTQEEVQPLDPQKVLTKVEAAKKEWREQLRVDEPVVGVDRQPILSRGKRKGGFPKGTKLKRVLTPRIKPNATNG